MSKAIIKYNNGNGAVLCSRCSVIIRAGSELTEEDRKFMRGELKLEAQYCVKCQDGKNKSRK